MPTAAISPSDWEKFILPVVEEHTVPSIVFYHIQKTEKDVLIHVRTVLNGFEICTTVLWNEIRPRYQDSEVAINDTGEMPTTLPDSLFERFNHDFMNGRGIPEVR